MFKKIDRIEPMVSGIDVIGVHATESAGPPEFRFRKHWAVERPRGRDGLADSHDRVDGSIE
jgi:hypothetical protein